MLNSLRTGLVLYVFEQALLVCGSDGGQLVRSLPTLLTRFGCWLGVSRGELRAAVEFPALA